MPQPDFVADTSAIVRRLRKDPSVESYFAGKDFVITYVTLAELSVGALKSRDPEEAWRQILQVLRGVDVIRVTALTPLLYAGIYHDLERRGQLIPVNDIWIAAVCLEADLPLLARDAHFSRVPHLDLISC